MLVSMSVRCEQCGFESDSRYRFCGMCGAKLPPPPPSSEPAVAKPVSREPTRPVSGPSFLGLADEPASPGAYLLEDEMSQRHWGRSLVLLMILGGLGAAGWHWRGEVREYVVARLAQRSSSNQSEQARSPAASMSTSASEVAPGVPSAPDTSSEKPKTGVGDMPATPSATAQTATPPVSSAANSEQPSTAPAAPPAQTQASATPPPAALAPSGTAETATADKEAPKAESAATRKSNVNEASAASTGADQLEAEGERYLYGTGVAANCSRAERDLQAAADQGSSKADSVLGTMYATGHCVSRDLPLAYRWFAMALKRDPSNARLQDDLRVLWNQMTPDERQLAMRRQ